MATTALPTLSFDSQKAFLESVADAAYREVALPEATVRPSLFLIGAKMMRDSFRGEGFDGRSRDPTRGMSLVVLSVATSIDALAAGLGIAVLGHEIVFPSIVIGIAAGCMTLVGMRFGKILGRWAGRGAEIAGGLILISLGIKILVEHMAA